MKQESCFRLLSSITESKPQHGKKTKIQRNVPNLCPVDFFLKLGCPHLGHCVLRRLDRADLQATTEASPSAEQFVGEKCDSRTRMVSSWLRSPLKPVTFEMANLVDIRTTCGGKRVVCLQEAVHGEGESGWWLSLLGLKEVIN